MSQPFGTRIYDICKPLAQAGDRVTLQPGYAFQRQNATDPEPPQLILTGPGSVFVQIDGPRVRLNSGDIAGVFPAAGSDDTPVEFLPHVALNRRTLPWERVGPGSGQSAWLALVLIKPSDLNGQSVDSALSTRTVAEIQSIDPAAYTCFTQQLKLDRGASLSIARLPNRLLKQILPAKEELSLLCHVKRLDFDAQGHDYRDYAIVVGNRLPTADPVELHTALLVSLEQRDDLYDALDHRVDETAPVQPLSTLIVLYSWTFTPTGGGDFEQVMVSIGFQPTGGGALRFGSAPAASAPGTTPLAGGFQPLLDRDGYPVDPLLLDGSEPVLFRGPLCPFPFKLPDPLRAGVALRAEPPAPGVGHTQDVSYAAAFELGRLMALGDTAVLQALKMVRGVVDRVINVKAINKLPLPLQKKDWVVDPGWEQPWNEVNPLLKTDENLRKIGLANLTGIQPIAAQLEQTVLPALSLPQPGGGGLPVVGLIDFAAAQFASLAKQFPEVRAAGR
jgi:hypothetical protein